MTLLVLPIVLFGPPIFQLVFGQEWGKAGELARWLSLWMVASFGVEAVSYAFTAGHANWLLLGWRVAYLGGLAIMFHTIVGLPIESVTRIYALYGLAAYLALAGLGWWATTRIGEDDVPPVGA
jgi:hypothetical protein